MTTYDDFRKKLEGRVFQSLAACQKETGATQSGFWQTMKKLVEDHGVRMIVDPTGVRVLFGSPVIMTTADISDRTGLSNRRVRQLAPELAESGLAHRGRPRSAWLFDPGAIDWIKKRREDDRRRQA